MDLITTGLQSEFGADVQDEKIVIDNNIITSTGPATGIDVAFKLLEMLTDLENTEIVKKYMRFEYYAW